MTDYLPKPLNRDRLIETVDGYLCDADSAASAASEVLVGGTEAGLADDKKSSSGPASYQPTEDARPASDDERSCRPVDFDSLLERCMGDQNFVTRILDKFKTRASADLGQLERSIAAGDPQETARLAHGLRGAAANMSAGPLRDVAGRLETMGRTGDLHDAGRCLIELRAEYRRVLECIFELTAARSAGCFAPQLSPAISAGTGDAIQHATAVPMHAQ
ncbi:MAG: Hpt domain-containing protein [Planctomycetes bacterium]|nr:Hpt domain-containing protein [Planctomycetota bacterium]